MSELINKNGNSATIRWSLLTGTSALVLAAHVMAAESAKAEEGERPQVWIELGGQFTQLDNGQEAFSPALMDARPSMFAPSEGYEKPSHSSIDETANLSFEPKNSDWRFSISVRYGRSSATKHVTQQTNPLPFVKYYYTSAPPTGRRLTKNTQFPVAVRFADTNVRNSEDHAVLDFQAGKDVGLGLFGRHDGSSVFGLGVRFAQFHSKSNIALKSDPDWHFNYKYFPSLVGTHFLSSKFTYGQVYHSNAASLTAVRNFRGIGPSLSWSASAPFTGNVQNGQLSLDWSVNAAVLFGRQRTRVHHQTTGSYHAGKYAVGRTITYQPTPVNQTRTRNVVVPNVGGALGLSWQLENFKASFGYKVDFFFNAMDAGIDTRQAENRGFYGPYASVSIGLGG